MFFSATVVTADRSVVTFKGLLLTDTNKSMNDDDDDDDKFTHTFTLVFFFCIRIRAMAEVGAIEQDPEL
jgi:hypothetical protein